MVKLDINKIKLLVYDFDGVMTDNKVHVDQFGNETVVVNRGDGLAISKFSQNGLNQIIISTEKNPVVQKRAEKLNIIYFQGIDDKKKTLMKYMSENIISPEEVMYIGNDINDIEAMKCVGYPIAPSDANERIKEICIHVTEAKGGDGVIRELIDLFY